jgi:hypothetical protein
VLQGVNVVEEDLNSSSAINNRLSNLHNQPQSQTKLDESSVNSANSAEEAAEREREENVRQLVSDCRKQLVEENEDCYGSWALINYTEYATREII